MLLRSSKEGKQSVPHLHASGVGQLWVSAHPGQRPFLRRAADLAALSQGCRMAVLTTSSFAHWLDTCFMNEFFGSFAMIVFLRICIPNRSCCFSTKEATADMCWQFSSSFPQAAQGGGHRTLLYGHAILLRHSFSGMVSTWRWQLSPFMRKKGWALRAVQNINNSVHCCLPITSLQFQGFMFTECASYSMRKESFPFFKLHWA